jgi:hypothetical protein
MEDAKTDIMPFDWVFASALGEEDDSKITKKDYLSYTCFDKTGQFLFMGDNAGRIIIF